MHGVVGGQAAAEQATGMRQRGALRPATEKDEGGKWVTWKQARERLLNKQRIYVPHAGAGSFEAVLVLCGFVAGEAWDMTSSSGDWTGDCTDGATDGEDFVWHQAPAHPYTGYYYSVRHGTCAELAEEQA